MRAGGDGLGGGGGGASGQGVHHEPERALHRAVLQAAVGGHEPVLGLRDWERDRGGGVGGGAGGRCQGEIGAGDCDAHGRLEEGECGAEADGGDYAGDGIDRRGGAGGGESEGVSGPDDCRGGDL